MYSAQKRRQALSIYYKDVNDVQIAWIPIIRYVAVFVSGVIAAWGITKGVDTAYEWVVEKFSSRKGGSDDKYRDLIDSLWSQQPESLYSDTVDMSNGKVPDWVLKAVDDGVVDTEAEAFAMTVNNLRDYLGSRQDNISREMAQFGSLYTALPRWYRNVCWESKDWMDFCERMIAIGRHSSGYFYRAYNQVNQFALSDLDAIADILTIGQQCVDRRTGIFSLANLSEYIDRQLVDAVSDATNGSFYDEGMILGAIMLMLNLMERRSS